MPAEQARLAAAYQVAEAKGVQQRTQQLAEDLTCYPRVMEQYQHRDAATQWLLRAAAGPAQPTAAPWPFFLAPAVFLHRTPSRRPRHARATTLASVRNPYASPGRYA